MTEDTTQRRHLRSENYSPFARRWRVRCPCSHTSAASKKCLPSFLSSSPKRSERLIANASAFCCRTGASRGRGPAGEQVQATSCVTSQVSLSLVAFDDLTSIDQEYDSPERCLTHVLSVECTNNGTAEGTTTSAEESLVQICFDFTKGRCARRNCKFSHDFDAIVKYNSK